MRKTLAAICALLCAAAPAIGQERPQAYVGARVVPISGAEIPNGVLVVHRGKIVDVGPAASVKIPSNAERVDVSGKVIMPGLVDTHSHIGGVGGADSSSPIQPDVRAYDSIDVRDAGIQKAQAGGITTVNVMPGSGHLLSGQTVYLKLRDGETIDDLAYKNGDGSPAGGIKMANGTNPMRAAGSPGGFPETRAKSVALVREQFVKAIDYSEKVRRANGDKEKLPARDLGLEALVDVLEGRRVVHHHTHRHDDIVTVLRLAKEFGFKVILQHVTEGHKVADEIARSGAPASIIVIDAPGGKLEAKELSIENGRILDQAGVLVGFHTDDGITDSRHFLRSAALAVRGGMPREKALAAMTINGAKMLDLQGRVGSLEAGKDADFIVLSGDPLSVYTKVLETYVEGVRVFDRNDPKDRLYAVGGYGASHDQHMHLDCYGETGGNH